MPEKLQRIGKRMKAPEGAQKLLRPCCPDPADIIGLPGRISGKPGEP